MQRNTSTQALIMAELAIGVLAAFFYLRLRLKVAAAFADFGTAVPPLTKIAISPSFMPAAVAVSCAFTLFAFLLPLKRSRQMRLVQLSVTFLASAVVFALLATFIPLLNP